MFRVRVRIWVGASVRNLSLIRGSYSVTVGCDRASVPPGHLGLGLRVTGLVRRVVPEGGTVGSEVY